ncbi:hypothetical protein SPI_08191 [Niveomyces insectorum RCEF 264]|uniref:Thymidylate kinase n=1 Tax=Niveomyces insectorum RCEF 264 TaxID=1081102 RepID=A0A167NFK0_9HYPO|nr:hypothetical protein SPI_08191 [Niveomyces insectorum RCEF 264]
MAAAVRRPFAPLDGARLQTLTNTKNRQNAVFLPTTKRKAPKWADADADDVENVDPGASKRLKGREGFLLTGITKKASITFVEASGIAARSNNTTGCIDVPSIPSMSRSMLKPKPPSVRLNDSLRNPSSRATPAGRCPVRNLRRNGILSTRRRVSSSLGRAGPATDNYGFAAPFSLETALKNTLSAYGPHPSTSVSTSTALHAEDICLGKAGEDSWSFNIHEDTPEQEMTNLLQHGTCVLDISSDEESEQKARREKAEGRDKENIPPASDISQTSISRMETANPGFAEKTRCPLSQLNVADYYASGCDEASTVLIPADEPVTDEDMLAVDRSISGTGTKAKKPSQDQMKSTITSASGSLIELDPAVVSSVDD